MAGACPICAAPLERVLGTFYCSTCRASLQSHQDFAAALDLSTESDRLFGDRDRHSDALTVCALCERGELHPERILGVVVAACRECRAVWIRGPQLERMRDLLRRDNLATASAREAAGQRPPDMNQIEFDDVWTNAFAYPAALGFGVLAHLLGLSFLVWGTANMWFHELGHAVVAWISGFFAMPLPFFTIASEVRSPVVIALMVIAISAMGAAAYRYRMWNVVIFAAVLFAFQIYLTFVLNAAQARQWGIFAGQAGAILLPTLVMVAFYQPIGWRWDFWRYLALPVAAVGLVHALLSWIAVARGLAAMPHGSAIGDDSQGDLERLVRVYKWTLTSLADAYISICAACFLALVIVYALYLRKALLGRRAMG